MKGREPAMDPHKAQGVAILKFILSFLTNKWIFLSWTSIAYFKKKHESSKSWCCDTHAQSVAKSAGISQKLYSLKLRYRLKNDGWDIIIILSGANY